MVSRPIVLSLLMAASVAASSSSSLPQRHLRASAAATAAEAVDASAENDISDGSGSSSSASSVDVPQLADSRRRMTMQQHSEGSQQRSVQDTTIEISQQCLNTLAAAANDNGQIKRENYFVFVDGMSNGYLTFNNMTSYSDMDTQTKFGYVTLSCQCHAHGGSGNCCQGARASLDVQGIDDPENMSEQLEAYVADICKVTEDSIGDNKMPPTGELPTTAKPTAGPTASSVPTASLAPTKSPTAAPTGTPTTSPTVKDVPAVVGPPGGGNPGNGGGGPNSDDGGLGGPEIFGIALASAAVVTLMIYILTGRSKDDPTDDDDLSQMSHQNGNKELLAITANGEMDPDRPPRVESPDATNSMTMSDVSSIPSMNTGEQQGVGNSYYANNSLLPGRPDEESMLSSSDGPSFFDTDDDTAAGGSGGGGDEEQGVEAHNTSSSALNTTSSSSGGESLDQAIESGNWEAVAASAAAIVKQNESMSTTSTGVEV